jgi:putative peptidoglycan lipid II flippase
LAAPGGNQVAAIALAYAVAYWITLAVTWWVLARRLGSLESRRTVWSLARMLIAGAVAAGAMLVILLVVLNLETGGIAATRKVDLLVNVMLTSIVGLGVYLFAAWVMRVTEVSDVLSLAGRLVRRGRGR